MEKHDMVWGGLLFALGIAIFALIPSQIKNAGGGVVGPRAFPHFLSILLMVCSAVLIIQNLSRRRKSGAEAQPRSTGETGGEEDGIQTRQKGITFALGIFALLVLYALAMRWAGYVAASLLFLMILLYLLGVRKKQLYALMIPIVLCVYAVFRMILHVQLP